MPDLDFQVESVDAALYAAVPMLDFRLRVTSAAADDDIANVSLQCQIRIEAPRRRYTFAEQEKLQELFGDPQHGSQLPRPLLWTHAGVLIPGFRGSCVADLPVPCSYDFNAAAVKYFYALDDGEVPLSFQFSGTIFYRDEDARLQISRIAWSKEARFALPVAAWQRMMDHYYPNSAWLCLDRGVFDRLYRYKRQHGLPSWEQALQQLLDGAEESVR